MTTTHIDTAEVAKIIRKELKAFPATKFSVRSSRYAGGSSIDVNWTDGPTEESVKAKIGKFQGATFDGMIDLKSYHDSIHEGQTVSFGNDFLFTRREYSVAFLSAVAADCSAKYGTSAPHIMDGGNHGYIVEDGECVGGGTQFDYYWMMRQVVLREAGARKA